MTRWMRPPEVERSREQDRFDPLVEGARHRLPDELLRKLWERVCRDLTDRFGRFDEEQAQKRFHELAARTAAWGGRLGPEVGRFTRVGTEIDGDSLGIWDVRRQRPHTPGRETLVTVEARRRIAQSERPAADGGALAPSSDLPATAGKASVEARVRYDLARARALEETLVEYLDTEAPEVSGDRSPRARAAVARGAPRGHGGNVRR